MRREATAHLGVVALLCFLIHGGSHVLRGTAHDVLWACTLANLLIGVGLLFRWPRDLSAQLCSIGVLWLCVGNFTWLLDLILGGEFFVTSLLTHWLGLGVGIWGLLRLGWPDRAWLHATLALIALQLVCRLLTPPAANVNVAHAVYAGYQRIYPSYAWFWLASFVQTAGAYFVLDRILRWLLPRWAQRLQQTPPKPA